MVERFICTEKVKGSTPLISIYGGVMKLVYMKVLEAFALRRVGSSPTNCTATQSLKVRHNRMIINV